MTKVNQTDYDGWKGISGAARSIEPSVDALLDRTSGENVNASRQNLENLINGNGIVVDGNSPDHMLINYAQPLEKTLDLAASNKFNSNPIGFVNKALADQTDQLKERYLSVKAYAGDKKKAIKTGDDVFDEALKYHYIASRIEDAIKNREKNIRNSKGTKEIQVLNQYMAETGDLVKAELTLYFMKMAKVDKSDKKAMKVIEKTVNAYMQAYTRTPEKVDGLVRFALNRAYQTVESLIPENRRAEYAGKVLEAKIKVKDLAGASKDLYGLIA